MTTKPYAVGAYIYAGGFTLGMQKHFMVDHHLEDEKPYGLATIKANMPHINVLKRSEWGKAHSMLVNADLIYGNPPCAAWSMAGRRGEHWRDDTRVDCTRALVELGLSYRPKAWAWESVSNVWGRGREFVSEVAEKFTSIGYQVTVLLHDAQHIGLPQIRKRFFLVATKFDLLPISPNWAPAPTFNEWFDGVDPGNEIKTSEQKFDYLFPLTPQGGKLKESFDLLYEDDPTVGRNAQGGVRGSPSFLLRRLWENKPAFTFCGAPMLHPTDDRFLSVKECQHLCGFPLDYQFIAKSDPAKLNLIARGVCPPVGEWLGKSLRQSMDLFKPAVAEMRIIDHRKPPEGV